MVKAVFFSQKLLNMKTSDQMWFAILSNLIDFCCFMSEIKQRTFYDVAQMYNDERDNKPFKNETQCLPRT